jgi:predicted membrane protein
MEPNSMEPNSMEPNNDPHSRWRDDTNGDARGNMPALLPGLILVGIGALFLLGNLHIVRIHDWFAYWPVILMAIGLARLVDSSHSGGRITGAVLLGIGGLFLADNLGYIWFSIWDLWPLILIGAGVMMLLDRTGRATRRWPHRHFAHWGTGPFEGSSAFGSNQVDEVAVFGGTRRVINDPDFQGGEIKCVFGGVNLDLSGANMVRNKAVIKIATVYGGVMLRVPTSWNVEVRGAGAFGGFADHTIHPPVTPETKRLIVKGAAVFGGVTIKN